MSYTDTDVIAPQSAQCCLVFIEEICWAALPFILCDLVVMGLLILWPSLVLWLPNLIAG